MNIYDKYGIVLRGGYKHCVDLLEGHAEECRKSGENFTAEYLMSMSDIIKKSFIATVDKTVEEARK